MKKTLKNKKGFTLIELIVVIAILGILAAIAVPRFAGVQTNAANRAHAANFKTLESAAAVCVANEGNPPVVVTWTTSASAAPATSYASGTHTSHVATGYLNGNGPTIPSQATTNPNGGAIGSGHTVYVVTIQTNGSIGVSTN